MPKVDRSLFTVQPAWDFDDHKGWDIFLGTRVEGQVSWIGEDHEMVKEGSLEPGWSYSGYVPNEDANGRGFKDLEETVLAFIDEVFNATQ